MTLQNVLVAPIVSCTAYHQVRNSVHKFSTSFPTCRKCWLHQPLLHSYTQQTQ